MASAMVQAQTDSAELDRREEALSARAQENEAAAAAQARSTAGDRAQLQALQAEFRRAWVSPDAAGIPASLSVALQGFGFGYGHCSAISSSITNRIALFSPLGARSEL